MKSFYVRLLSAAIAILSIAGLYYWLGDFAFKIIVAIAVVVGSLEVSTLLFKKTEHFVLRAFFYLICWLLAYLSHRYFYLSGNFLAVAILLYICSAIILSRKFDKIEELKHWILSGVMGLFYVGLLPIFAAKLLDLEQGVAWFLSLLLVVFAGDIGAYAFGMLWGKNKMFPHLSPKKSWQGSIGGILFSVIAAGLCGFYALNLNGPLLTSLIALGLVSAIFAQLGDFFESLLKRVADVKDSGQIMPGHGGVLDRIDGVLFASPVFYLGAVLIQTLL